MQLLYTTAYIILFIILLAVTVYNWIYAKGAKQAKSHLGIELNPLLARIVNATLLFSMLATLTIGVFMLLSLKG